MYYKMENDTISIFKQINIKQRSAFINKFSFIFFLFLYNQTKPVKKKGGRKKTFSFFWEKMKHKKDFSYVLVVYHSIDDV